MAWSASTCGCGSARSRPDTRALPCGRATRRGVQPTREKIPSQSTRRKSPQRARASRPRPHTGPLPPQHCGSEEYSGAALVTELQPERFAVERQHMVETQVRAAASATSACCDAMARVPRHEFVEPRYRDQAYEDHPLPIAAGQTISQPYIVALMLDLLQLNSSSKVLEIGTGSGYQTAVLTQLAEHVYSVERHPELARQAAGNIVPARFDECQRGDRRRQPGLGGVCAVRRDCCFGGGGGDSAGAVGAVTRGWTHDHPRRTAGGAGVAIGPQAGREGVDQPAGRVPVCAVDQGGVRLECEPATQVQGQKPRARAPAPHGLCFTILVWPSFAICG